jgi:hypothetical protein
MVKIDKKELIDKRFGSLTVIDYTYTQQSKKVFLWICKCDCGKEVMVRNTRIRSSRGCGKCAMVLVNKEKNDVFKQPHFSLKRRLYLAYKKNAIKENKDFNLIMEDCFKLFEGECFYCGEQPKPTKSKKGNSVDGLFLRNGIDRLDNTVGYIKSNVVSCCDICNYSKHTKGYNEFLSWIDKVYNHQIKKRSSTIPQGSTSQVNGDGNGTNPTMEG